MIKPAWNLAQSLPRWLEGRFVRWASQTVMQMHAPVQVAPGEYALCARCRILWPCTEFVEASDRLAAYRGEQG